MLEVAAQTPAVKDENTKTSPPVTTQSELNPPIITHTAATPMPTPQGSPNDHGPKECNKVTLCVHPPVEMSTLSVRSSSVSLTNIPDKEKLHSRHGRITFQTWKNYIPDMEKLHSRHRLTIF